MKFILSLCIPFLLISFARSQTTGKIFYEDKLDMHHSLPPEKEELKVMIPQFSTSNWELTFTENESIYQPLKVTELTGTSANQSSYFMRFGRENRIVYKNLPGDEMTDSRDFMQKQFLIKGFVTSRQWKIGKKQPPTTGTLQIRRVRWIRAIRVDIETTALVPNDVSRFLRILS